MDLNEAILAKNLALKLLTFLEDCEIRTIRLKAYVLSLPEAEQPGFSLDDLLQEDALTADIEQVRRKLYGETRGLIAGFPGSSEGLQKALEELAATRRG
jgi:hypothetical protein